MEKDPGHEERIILEEGEDEASFRKILKWVGEKGVPFKHFSHKPVKTSEEASLVRGVDLNTGAKALLIKYSITEGAKFALLVMSAGRKVSWREVKNFVKSKNVSFAKVDEVKELTGCIPGAVPPFGSVFGLQTYMDPSLSKQGETINFNIGLRSQSLQMATKDYIEVEKPIVETFTTD